MLYFQFSHMAYNTLKINIFVNFFNKSLEIF